MRTLRLGRTFDAVLVHDAVMYMTTEADLRQAIETAYVHVRPGGVAVFAPDFVKETFKPSTDHGGHDGDGRALRYLEWSFDPDPDDTTVHRRLHVRLPRGRRPALVLSRIGTSSGCSAARSGSGCSARSGSSRSRCAR